MVIGLILEIKLNKWPVPSQTSLPGPIFKAVGKRSVHNNTQKAPPVAINHIIRVRTMERWIRWPAWLNEEEKVLLLLQQSQKQHGEITRKVCL